MTPEQFERVLVGTRVTWRGFPSEPGIVTEVHRASRAMHVRWARGPVTLHTCDLIELAPEPVA